MNDQTSGKRDFLRNDSGSIVPLAVTTMAVMIIGAGVGIDVLRTQNARSAATQVAGMICNRAAKADLALYPDAASRTTLANNFAQGAIQKTSLNPASTNYTVNVTDATATTDGQVNVTVNTSIKTTLTRILGQQTTSGSGTQSCTYTKNAGAPNVGCCPAGTTVYMNIPYSFSADITKINGDARDYVVTIFDSNYVVLNRAVFGFNQTKNAVSFPNLVPQDKAVIQPFNADGSIPALCNPTPACTGSQNPPSTQPPACISSAVQVTYWLDGYWGAAIAANTGVYAPYTPPLDVVTQIQQQYNSTTTNHPTAMNVFLPGAVPTDGGGSGLATGLRIPLSRGYIGYISVSDRAPVGVMPDFWFQSEYMSYQNLTNGGNPLDTNNGSAITNLSYSNGDPATLVQNIAAGNGGSGWMHDNPGILARGGKLMYVTTASSALWELNGNCYVAISPIVLDLPGLGHIATTGASTAHERISPWVGKTISFDMQGDGHPIRMEWLTGNGQAFLVDDRDGNAARDMNGRRLFGSVGGFSDGYKKLAELDVNHDGVLSGEELTGLKVWIDNGDGVVQDGELKTLAEVGVTELSVRSEEKLNGRDEKLTQSYAIRNGERILTEDVWFGLRRGEALAAATEGRN